MSGLAREVVAAARRIRPVTARGVHPESVELVAAAESLAARGKQPAEIVAHLLAVYSEEPPAEIPGNPAFGLVQGGRDG